jgi:excisionase family DNA binding protein
MDRKTISVPEAAKLLGIGRSAAYLAARKKEIPTIKVGRRVLVPLAPFERLLDPQRAEEPGN